MIVATIGEQITAARKAKGMTQEALASAMNITRAAVSHWEKGRTMPDAETLLRLSQVLGYSFETASELAPDTPQAQPAQPAPQKNRKQLIIIVAALAVVVLVACLLIIPKLTKKPESLVLVDRNGVQFDVADFQKTTPGDPSKPYITVTPTLEIRKNGDAEFYSYAFTLREDNGIPFSITQTEAVYFWENLVDSHIYTAEQLEEFDLECDLPAYGTFVYEGGQNARRPDGTRNGVGIGFRVTGIDPNGETLTFTGYLPLPQD